MERRTERDRELYRYHPHRFQRIPCQLCNVRRHGRLQQYSHQSNPDRGWPRYHRLRKQWQPDVFSGQFHCRRRNEHRHAVMARGRSPPLFNARSCRPVWPEFYWRGCDNRIGFIFRRRLDLRTRRRIQRSLCVRKQRCLCEWYGNRYWR